MDKQYALVRTNDFHIELKDVVLASEPPMEHCHDAFELAFFIKSNIEIFVHDQSYEITDGDVMLLGEYDIHRMLYHKNEAYKRYVINFKKHFIADVLKSVGCAALLDGVEKHRLPKVRPTSRLERRQLEALCESI